VSNGLPFDPLDPQRDAVYAAELEVWPREKDAVMSLSELQGEADRILGLPWFARAFPKTKRQIIKDGRGSQWSRAGDDCIHLLRKSRVRDVLIHELTHRVIPPGAEWHGALFCGILLYLAGKLYDLKTKDKLRRAFKRNGCVWDRRAARWGDLNRNGREGEV
jgi:hypothetical protein